LSTLTKTLIVLLTVFSIFLCGLVVTYVANVDNYKQKYDTLYNDFRAAKENEKDAQRQLREKIEETDRQKEQLNGEISSLTMMIGELEAKLDKFTRENAMLLQKVSSMASLVEAANQTAQQQTKLFEDAEKELAGVRAEQIKQRNELKETTDALIEKIAIVSTLQEKNKQMLEEKTELQTKLDQLLRQYGRVIAPPTPVTPRREIARPAPAPAMPVTKDIGLKGLVTAVDLENSLAEISIGTADGVRNEMKFHVTRGDKFICDILILDVDSDRAVGILELVQQPPRVGDSVSTNL
jgi:TolA-binding protein